MTNTTPILDVLPLQLTDLVPQNAAFTLKEIKDAATGEAITLTLKRWSLLVRKYVIEKYTAHGVRLAFEKAEIGVISDVAYYLLDDESKKHFKTYDNFLESVVTIQDQINIITAVVKTMGIGEVELKKISDALAPKPQTATVESEAADPNLVAPNT